ncbi:glycosyltransferase [Lacticaseibacillus pantheris]|uniref:glycosyltransferase n=1 Tax=Lacticaseibacillus pantheris TaxID=171523 RepID=UPI002658D31B|nr:glycosyltransferase [Lacticaseibacillus pantheris]WKF84154.1 glycosyltransferase [Lacticaseibacillus pantheris]
MKNKKKVAILIPQFYWGGMPRVASNLVELLVERYDVTIVLVNNKLEIRENTYGAQVLRLSGGKFHKLLELRQVLHREKYSAVISFGIIDNILNIILNSKYSRTIITEHSTKSFDNEIEPNPLKKKIYTWCMKHLYKHADNIVCVSQGIADDLRQTYGVKNTSVIYNVIKNDRQADALNTADDNLLKDIRHRDGRIILNAGRITPAKGQLNLVKAMKFTPANFHLVLLGEGPDVERIMDYTKSHGLGDRVHYVGFRKNISSWMRESDLYASMSWFEGFPTVLSESLLAGTPVVSSDIFSGPREILSNGRLIDYLSQIKYPYILPNGVLADRFDFRDFMGNSSDFAKIERRFGECLKIAMNTSFELKFNFISSRDTFNRYKDLIEG